MHLASRNHANRNDVLLEAASAATKPAERRVGAVFVPDWTDSVEF